MFVPEHALNVRRELWASMLALRVAPASPSGLRVRLRPGVESYSIGDTGRAKQPHRNLPLVPELSGLSRVRGVAKSLESQTKKTSCHTPKATLSVRCGVAEQRWHGVAGEGGAELRSALPAW